MEYLYKKHFLSAFKSLKTSEQFLVRETVHQIQDYHKTRQAAYGLRIKKLFQSSEGKVFEARPTIALRILWVEGEGIVSFVLLGSRDEVRRYLKSL
ncbi:MAG: hypothetical protein A2901_01335 [Elusimicrobia bacterium RIFCSPLOWO2_01_FULL_54_10]|nr:MAG: hypothetical protein A2901_01335 [Elusimicrobia bacterium RIFCSPLOWO2_01_FULL_54_10]